MLIDSKIKNYLLIFCFLTCIPSYADRSGSVTRNTGVIRDSTVGVELWDLSLDSGLNVFLTVVFGRNSEAYGMYEDSNQQKGSFLGTFSGGSFEFNVVSENISLNLVGDVDISTSVNNIQGTYTINSYNVSLMNQGSFEGTTDGSGSGGSGSGSGSGGQYSSLFNLAVKIYARLNLINGTGQSHDSAIDYVRYLHDELNQFYFSNNPDEIILDAVKLCNIMNSHFNNVFVDPDIVTSYEAVFSNFRTISFSYPPIFTVEQANSFIASANSAINDMRIVALSKRSDQTYNKVEVINVSERRLLKTYGTAPFEGQENGEQRFWWDCRSTKYETTHLDGSGYTRNSLYPDAGNNAPFGCGDIASAEEEYIGVVSERVFNTPTVNRRCSYTVPRVEGVFVNAYDYSSRVNHNLDSTYCGPGPGGSYTSVYDTERRYGFEAQFEKVNQDLGVIVYSKDTNPSVFRDTKRKLRVLTKITKEVYDFSGIIDDSYTARFSSVVPIVDEPCGGCDRGEWCVWPSWHHNGAKYGHKEGTEIKAYTDFETINVSLEDVSIEDGTYYQYASASSSFLPFTQDILVNEPSTSFIDDSINLSIVVEPVDSGVLNAQSIRHSVGKCREANEDAECIEYEGSIRTEDEVYRDSLDFGIVALNSIEVFRDNYLFLEYSF